MIINENLLLGYGHHNNVSQLLRYTTSAISPIAKGRKYTISYIVKNTNRFGVYTDVLSNGIYKPYISQTEIRNWKETKIGEKIKYTFTADKDGYVVVYIDNNSENVDTKVEEPYFKIEEGEEATPYIPSKSMLDPSNQAIFLAGGYSKRCIQSKLKTSRFRPVMFGGGIC